MLTKIKILKLIGLLLVVLFPLSGSVFSEDGVVYAQNGGGTITGWVRDISGNPIEGIHVAACDYTDDSKCWWAFEQSPDDGSYVISDLPSGDYRVHAYQNPPGLWLNEFYDDIPGWEWEQATPVSVTESSETPDINFELALGSAISGVVKTVDGAPVNGLWVEACPFDTEGQCFYAWTNVDGSYSIFPILPGKYRLNVEQRDDWMAEYYKDTPYWDLAKAVKAKPGKDTIIDFTLKPGGTISGWVRDTSGNPIVGIHVAVCDYYDDSRCWWAFEQSPVDGSYSVHGLPTGLYRVSAYSVIGGDWIHEFYNDTVDWNWADPVEVTAGTEGTDDINFELSTEYYNPVFLINLTSNEIHSWGWYVGTGVTLNIYEPGTDGSLVHTDIAWPESTGRELWDTSTWFSFPAELEVGTGYRVTLSAGATTKEHFITSLSVLSVDTKKEEVAGISAPNAVVIIDSWQGAMRQAIADKKGYWSVDFSVPGTEDWEQDVIDIGPGDGGGINIYDRDGDSTNINWRVPNPRLDAWPEADYIDAWDWTPGLPLTMTIDGLTGSAYSETQTPDYPDWDPNQTYAQFYFAGSFDLKPGDTITLDNGLQTKVYNVTYLVVTGFDLDIDLVFGEASPDSTVWIWVCDETNCALRHEIAGTDGSWTADFGQPGDEPFEDVTWDLIPGSSGGAGEQEDDGDSTIVDWWVPE